MTTHEVSSNLSRINGLNTQQIPSYQQSVEENNINGMVLSQCELDELGKVLGMKFGDWQLFKTVVLSLREAEEVQQQQQQLLTDEVDGAAETALNTQRNRTNSIISAKSIHFQELENSGSSISTLESESSSRAKLGYNTQVSVEAKRLDSTSEAPVVFDTIQEDIEPPAQSKRIKRNDSVVAELMYESGLLHQAMQSFAEDNEEEEELEPESEVEIAEEKPSSKSRGLPVQFSLTSQRSSTSIDRSSVERYYNEGNGSQNAYDSSASEQDPLLTRRLSDVEVHHPYGNIAGSPITGSPRPILKKPKPSVSGSQVSLSDPNHQPHNQSLLDLDMAGSEPDLTYRKQSKSPHLLQTDKSISLSSTGFVAMSDQHRPSMLSSKGNSIDDSLEVINENITVPPRNFSSNSSSQQGSPQKMNIMSIEDSIKQFTMDSAHTASPSHGRDRAGSFDDFSGSSSTGSFKTRSDSLHLYEEGDLSSKASKMPTNSESFV